MPVVDLDQDSYYYTFGGHPPVLGVEPGTVIDVTTEDCFNGLVRSTDDLPSAVCDLASMNPVSGPIEIFGAEPGDVLAVHFVSITPIRDWAVSSTFPHFGALTTSHQTPMLHEALEERVWRYDVDVPAGTVTYHARASDLEVVLALDPFHGTVGVSPAGGEVISTLTPAAHGGNLDTPELRAGTTLYLPVNVPGAMLSLGDGHCRQGEGEIGGVAVEAAMKTRIIVDLIKGGAPAWPRIESDEFWMTTGSVRGLTDANRIAQSELVGWLQELTDLDRLDALQLISQAGLAPVGNAVDTNYTMVGKLPTAILPGLSAYGGLHARLRRQAATL